MEQLAAKIRHWLARGATAAMFLTLLAPVAQAAALNCEELNDPAKTKGFVISIIEEQLGTTEGAEGTEGEVLPCFRETTCKTEPEDKPGSKEPVNVRTCNSKYVDVGNCTPSDDKKGNIVSCNRVQVFIAKSGLDLLFSYLGLIYRWSAGVIGIVSVFYLVYGGVKIATAGDNSGAIDEAKNKIIQSIAGLILLFLSAIILYTINPNFFVL